MTIHRRYLITEFGDEITYCGRNTSYLPIDDQHTANPDCFCTCMEKIDCPDCIMLMEEEKNTES